MNPYAAVGFIEKCNVEPVTVLSLESRVWGYNSRPKTRDTRPASVPGFHTALESLAVQLRNPG
jgi:hypothetical protein